MNRLVLFLVFGLLMNSCSPRVKSNLLTTNYEELTTNVEIIVLEDYDTLPADSELIGEIKIGDSGFSTDCGYHKVIDEAKLAAKKSGANIVQITKVKKPNVASTCFRINANLYRNFNSSFLKEHSLIKSKTNISRLPEDADYALIHFYRPKNITGVLIGYKIREGENTIGRARNGEKFVIRTKKFGERTFWARTEIRETVTVNIEKGQEYFVRCEVRMGIGMGQPEMYVVNNDIGIKEYEEID